MPKIAIFRDFREEYWPSMDLVADMLFKHASTAAPHWKSFDVTPRFQNVAGRFRKAIQPGRLHNVNRLWNRMVRLPRAAREMRANYDVFHVADHSYAHLIHSLPAERSGVYCHDLDTFRSVLTPELERRPWWFRSMTSRILGGLRKAAVVFHSTSAVSSDLIRLKLVAPERLRHAPYGVAREFFEPSEAECPAIIRSLANTPFLLHVGSCIPRKRVDRLISVFEQLKTTWPQLILVKVGDQWPVAEANRLRSTGLERSVIHLGKLASGELAATYHRAAALLVTSEAEGFGLPVIEAMASGTPVVASKLPAICEAGGPEAAYVHPEDLNEWYAATCRVLSERTDEALRRRRRDWAAQYSWQNHTRTILSAYDECLEGSNTIGLP